MLGALGGDARGERHWHGDRRAGQHSTARGQRPDRKRLGGALGRASDGGVVGWAAGDPMVALGEASWAMGGGGMTWTSDNATTALPRQACPLPHQQPAWPAVQQGLIQDGDGATRHAHGQWAAGSGRACQSAGDGSTHSLTAAAARYCAPTPGRRVVLAAAMEMVVVMMMMAVVVVVVLCGCGVDGGDGGGVVHAWRALWLAGAVLA